MQLVLGAILVVLLFGVVPVAAFRSMQSLTDEQWRRLDRSKWVASALVVPVLTGPLALAFALIYFIGWRPRD